MWSGGLELHVEAVTEALDLAGAETGTGTWRSHVWRHGKDQNRGVATILSRKRVTRSGLTACLLNMATNCMKSPPGTTIIRLLHGEQMPSLDTINSSKYSTPLALDKLFKEGSNTKEAVARDLLYLKDINTIIYTVG